LEDASYEHGPQIASQRRRGDRLAGATNLAEFAKAWAQTNQWKPEPGAQLSMLRWKFFVQSEDDAFVA